MVHGGTTPDGVNVWRSREVDRSRRRPMDPVVKVSLAT